MNAPATLYPPQHEAPCETIASAHAVELVRHLNRAMVAMRDRDPILAATELLDVQQRLTAVVALAERLACEEYGALPDELRACADCGNRMGDFGCACSPPLAEDEP